MAEFVSYYDTSGHRLQQVIVTVGLLGSARQWVKFEREWRRALAAYDLPYIHMKDLAPNQRVYARFKREPEKKKALIQRLVRVISRNTTRMFVRGVEVDGYRAANARYCLEEAVFSPFALAAGSCAEHVTRWLLKTNPKQAAKHFHESGDHNWGTLDLFLRRQNIAEVAPLDKVDSSTGEWRVPFQAADFVAWEFRRSMIDWNSVRKVRRSWQAIMQRFGHQDDCLFLDKPSLFESCRNQMQERA